MSALGFSFIDSSELKNIEQSTNKHSRTLRKRHIKKSSKIDNLLNSLSATQAPVMEGFSGDRQQLSDRADDDGQSLANFEALTKGVHISKDSYQNMHSEELAPTNIQVEEDNNDGNGNSENGQFGEVTQENFAQLGQVTKDDYYKQYVPYYSQLQGSQADVHTNKDALMTKLNYMIHLLEEQQDEKTDNVTEELVLYLFLGVFVIFVVDSFARVGKYKR
uniref:Uncharacterized protein n=1 Tax=viral metagenome TaxID=1070528 RepID=A0A6C0EMD0_9ZZZZ